METRFTAVKGIKLNVAAEIREDLKKKPSAGASNSGRIWNKCVCVCVCVCPRAQGPTSKVIR
jgi:hypothetical protein